MKIETIFSRSAHVKHDFASYVGKAASVISLGTSLSLISVGHAFADGPTAPTGGLGAQVNSMSSELMSLSSEGFGVGCYVGAAICFAFGVWALWQSRQPQNRESGNIGKGLAGIVLCGLLATAGIWINKAAVSASGSSASITDNTSPVAFSG